MNIKTENLIYAKELYLSWGNLARAGFQNEILKEYANYRIRLTDNDVSELRRIFYCEFSDRWEHLIEQNKEKLDDRPNQDNFKVVGAIDNDVPPPVLNLHSSVGDEDAGGSST